MYGLESEQFRDSGNRTVSVFQHFARFIEFYVFYERVD